MAKTYEFPGVDGQGLFSYFHLDTVCPALNPKATFPLHPAEDADCKRMKKMRMLLLADVAFLAMASATAKTGYLAITDASTLASLGWVS